MPNPLSKKQDQVGVPTQPFNGAAIKWFSDLLQQTLARLIVYIITHLIRNDHLI